MNRDAEAPFRLARWVIPVILLVTIALAGFIVGLWTGEGSDNLTGIQTLLTLFAFAGAVIAALIAYTQFREWSAEHQRLADIDMWIEISHRADVPGVRLDAVRSEADLPEHPMFQLDTAHAVVRAIVHVRDRFPLHNCTLNVVVPAHWDVSPLQESANHRIAGTVTPNARVNPDSEQNHAVRYTVYTGDISPRGYFAAQVRIEDAAGSSDPFRLMVELSCTPAAPTEAEQIRFALLAPRRFV